MSRLLDLLAAFHGKRVVVLGDLILDEYVLGRPARLSREAPIVSPGIRPARRCCPAAARRPACNIQSLGGQAVQVGVIGADKAGEKLRAALASAAWTRAAWWWTPSGRRSSSRASWPGAAAAAAAGGPH